MQQFFTIESILFIAWATALYPLGRSLIAMRKTCLIHALGWAIGAVHLWMITRLLSIMGGPTDQIRFLALVLTACSVIAILGARQPGAAAWNFVVVGLVSVLSLPLLQGIPHSKGSPELVWRILLCGILLFGSINYWPTRRMWGFSLFLLGAGGNSLLHYGERLSESGAWISWATLDLLAISNIWWIYLRRNRLYSQDPFDALWLRFRDTYGLAWAKRVQEQFDNAARNRGDTARLGRHGLIIPVNDSLDSSRLETLHHILKSVLKRFGVLGEQL